MKKRWKLVNLSFAWLANIDTFGAVKRMNSDKRHWVCYSEISGGIIFSTASSLSNCIDVFFFSFLTKKEKCKKNARVKYVI